MVAFYQGRLECWECEDRYVIDTRDWQKCRVKCEDALCGKCDVETRNVC